MLFHISFLNLLLIIILCLINNLTINLTKNIVGTPIYGVGGHVIAFNKSSHEEIAGKLFRDFWEYSITWCNVSHKYINNPDISIKSYPIMMSHTCNYDMYNYLLIDPLRSLNFLPIFQWIAITLCIIDLLIAIGFDISIYKTITNVNISQNEYKTKKWSSTFFLLMVSIGIPLMSYIWMIVIMSALLQYTSNNYEFQSDKNPIKFDINTLYIWSIFVVTLFTLHNASYKFWYIPKMITESNDYRI